MFFLCGVRHSGPLVFLDGLVLWDRPTSQICCIKDKFQRQRSSKNRRLFATGHVPWRRALFATGHVPGPGPPLHSFPQPVPPDVSLMRVGSKVRMAEVAATKAQRCAEAANVRKCVFWRQSGIGMWAGCQGGLQQTTLRLSSETESRLV